MQGKCSHTTNIIMTCLRWVISWGRRMRGVYYDSCEDVEIFLWARHVALLCATVFVCFFLGQIKNEPEMWHGFMGWGLACLPSFWLGPLFPLTLHRSPTVANWQLTFSLLLFCCFFLVVPSPMFSCGLSLALTHHSLCMRCSRESVLAAWSHGCVRVRAGRGTLFLETRQVGARAS